MEEQILKAATEITVAAIQKTARLPAAQPMRQYASELFKAVYEAVKEATSASTSGQPAMVG